MAGPTVYGAPDGSYRPWLPVWFERWQGLNEVCYLYLVYLAGIFIAVHPSSSLA